MQTSPTKAYERIIKRRRLDENLISLDYVTQIHERHEELFNQNSTSLPFPVLVLDADIEFEQDQASFELMSQQLADFINQHKSTLQKTSSLYSQLA